MVVLRERNKAPKGSQILIPQSELFDPNSFHLLEYHIYSSVVQEDTFANMNKKTQQSPLTGFKIELHVVHSYCI